jgi:glyoxylase-like metal-dependent hydrolase (beta-lactamase superfamily II)
LPFALDHVNIYIVDDGNGWAIVDTGVGDDRTETAWRELLAGPLSGRPITCIIGTHYHPDHIGMAGWLTKTLSVPLYMSESEFLIAQHFETHRGAVDGYHRRSLYRRHGMDEDLAAGVIGKGHSYQRLITGLPENFIRLEHGNNVTIGGRRFEVLTGGGHSSDQVMLFCRDDNLFLVADQVLPRITPNISVTALEPLGDPLGRYLSSMATIQRIVPPDAVVLPGHDWPFADLHDRIDKLVAHHRARCETIAQACRLRPHNTLELMPLLFRRSLDLHQLSFAFTETLAHVNYMVAAGDLHWITSGPYWTATA